MTCPHVDYENTSTSKAHYYQEGMRRHLNLPCNAKQIDLCKFILGVQVEPSSRLMEKI